MISNRGISITGLVASAIVALVILVLPMPWAEASTSTGARAVTSPQVGTGAPADAAASRQGSPVAYRERHVVVTRGDTLSGLAARFAVRGGWHALYAANRRVVGPDPDLLTPGTRLAVPRARVARPERYEVVPGDTLSDLSTRFDVPGGWRTVYAANRAVVGPDPDLLRPGQALDLRVGVEPAAPHTPGGPAAHPSGLGHGTPGSTVPGARRLSSGAERVATHALVGQPGAAAPGAAMPGHGARYPAAPAWVEGALGLAGAVALVALVAEPMRHRRRRAGAPGVTSTTARSAPSDA